MYSLCDDWRRINVASISAVPCPDSPVSDPLVSQAAPIPPSSRPARPDALSWEIIGYPRGGKGGLVVFERLSGSEALAGARAAYWELRKPTYVVTYRQAR